MSLALDSSPPLDQKPDFLAILAKGCYHTSGATKSPIFRKVWQMKEGFLVNKGEYAAIPYGNQYIIIHDGQQLEKLCRTESSARKYIQDCKKGKSVAELPID